MKAKIFLMLICSLCTLLLTTCEEFLLPDYPICIEDFPADDWQTDVYCHELSSSNSTYNPYPRVDFINASTGFIFNEQSIYKTTDGGKSFTPVQTDLPYLPVLIDFVDEQQGFCFLYEYAEEYTGAMYKTSDGGSTWELLCDSIITTFNFPVSLDFFDDQYGFAICSGYAIYTNDGGHTWAKTADLDFRWFDPQIQLLNDSTAYATVQGVDYVKTTDRGMTWDSVELNNSSGIHMYEFLSLDEVFAIHIDGSLYRSTDAGGTWTYIEVPFCANENKKTECDEIEFLHFADSQHGFLIGTGYYYDGVGSSPFTVTYTTSDGGATWQTNIINSFKTASRCFIDPDHGFIWDGFQNLVTISR